MKSTNSKLMLRTIALLGVAMAIVVLFLAIRGPSSFPVRTTLEAVTGPASWVTPDRYSIRFGLAGHSRAFKYAHKSGDSAAVASVLADTSKQPITILVDPGDPKQGLADDPFFQVYEFSSSRALVRSYAQVRNSWASDYRLGYLVVLLLFSAACVLEYAARRCAA